MQKESSKCRRTENSPSEDVVTSLCWCQEHSLVVSDWSCFDGECGGHRQARKRRMRKRCAKGSRLHSEVTFLSKSGMKTDNSTDCNEFFFNQFPV